MKNYIKPTFTLAGLFPVALAASCTISEAQKEDLEWMFGGDWSKAFFDANDGCGDNPTGIDGYCKFAYAEDKNYNYAKILNSF